MSDVATLLDLKTLGSARSRTVALRDDDPLAPLFRALRAVLVYGTGQAIPLRPDIVDALRPLLDDLLPDPDLERQLTMLRSVAVGLAPEGIERKRWSLLLTEDGPLSGRLHQQRTLLKDPRRFHQDSLTSEAVYDFAALLGLLSDYLDEQPARPPAQAPDERHDSKVKPDPEGRPESPPDPPVRRRKWIVAAVLAVMITALGVVTADDFLRTPGDDEVSGLPGPDTSAGLDECSDRSIATGWGPDRELYSLDAPPDYPTFNSLDSRSYGDERSFLDARLERQTASGSYCNSLEVSDGDIVVLRAYAENSAIDALGGDDGLGTGTAQDVQISFVTDAERATLVGVTATIHASNTRPSDVWDRVVFRSDRPFRLDFELGSAIVYSNRSESPEPLSSKIWGDWVYLPGPAEAGTIPPGFEHEQLIELKARITAVG